MTMHAAKGLEFPIVFLVNLHMPGRGRPAGVSVIEQGPDGAPVVEFDTGAAGKLEDRRESEELRRLLYVAVTRARDRLYLAGEIDKKGALRAGARSLGGLLPAGLKQAFAAAAAETTATEVTWTTETGAFALAVCRAPEDPAAIPVPPPPPEPPPADVRELRARGRRLRAVTDLTPPGPQAPGPAEPGAKPGDRTVGVVVHRLFQRRIPHSGGLDAVTSAARTLVDIDDLVDGADPGQVASQAAEVYLRLRERPEVDALLGSGDTHFEVPFSFAPRDSDAVLRGVIDCLVLAPDGTATVIEFKTGAARPGHEAQADIYAQAVSAVLGGREVSVKILYA
jgi:ATP-dependent helicase/nuclease subunit A